MSKLVSYPLRRNLILAMIGIIAIALFVDRLYEYGVVRASDVEREYSEQLRQQSYALSMDYMGLLLAGDSKALRMSVAARGTHALIQRLALTDDGGTILASTRVADHEQQANAVLDAFDHAAFSAAQRSNQIVIRVSAGGNDLYGYTPVPLPPADGELRALRRGILYTHMNIEPARAASWQHLFSPGSLLRWGLTLLVATLLILVLINRQIFRPLRHLQAVACRLGAGDWQARSALAGHGELARLGHVFNDMCDQILRDHQELRSREELYQSMADHGHALIWMSGTDKLCFYFNKPWLDFTGRSLAQEFGNGWTEGVHPDDYQRCLQVYDKAFDRRELFSMEYRLRHADGEYRWIIDEGTPRFDERGEFLGYVGHCLDITERRRAEEILQQDQQRLEALVNQRTSELALAKDAAEAANVAKSAFLANMSHELRTPLHGVTAMISLARQRMIDPRGIDHLEKAGKAARHLQEVINDILDLSKIEAERMVLESVDFKLLPVFENLISAIGIKARSKGLTFSTDLSPELGEAVFRGDPLRLGQILINLTGNAVKFTDHGSVTVRARAVDSDAHSLRIRFEVIDTGIGIAAADKGRLFGAFEQADSSTTRKYGGTGLGLAISQRLAQLMGGQIDVSSQPGQGSTFWFEACLARGKAQALDAHRRGASMAGEDLLKSFRGLHILVAEDDPVNQEVSRLLLEDVGLVPDIAEDGEVALQKARQQPYALILMDMRMPRLNGIDASRAIRTESQNRTTPIIAMTANAFAEDRERCLEAGMNDHLAKPANPDRLYEMLARWLARGGSKTGG